MKIGNLSKNTNETQISNLIKIKFFNEELYKLNQFFSQLKKIKMLVKDFLNREVIEKSDLNYSKKRIEEINGDKKDKIQEFKESNEEIKQIGSKLVEIINNIKEDIFHISKLMDLNKNIIISEFFVNIEEKNFIRFLAQLEEDLIDCERKIQEKEFIIKKYPVTEYPLYLRFKKEFIVNNYLLKKQKVKNALKKQFFLLKYIQTEYQSFLDKEKTNKKLNILYENLSFYSYKEKYLLKSTKSEKIFCKSILIEEKKNNEIEEKIENTILKNLLEETIREEINYIKKKNLYLINKNVFLRESIKKKKISTQLIEFEKKSDKKTTYKDLLLKQFLIHQYFHMKLHLSVNIAIERYSKMSLEQFALFKSCERYKKLVKEDPYTYNKHFLKPKKYHSLEKHRSE